MIPLVIVQPTIASWEEQRVINERHAKRAMELAQHYFEENKERYDLQNEQIEKEYKKELLKKKKRIKFSENL